MALVALAGCSYAPSPNELVADGGPDAPLTGDDAHVPAWIVVETMTIDTAQPTPQVSVMSLAAGVTYRLRVSGIAQIIDGVPGDAEYWDFDNPKDNACCEDVGIGIDDPVVDLDTTPDWGPYNPQHIYEVEWPGAGNPISAAYQDTVYGNNTGNLQLEILVFQ